MRSSSPKGSRNRVAHSRTGPSADEGLSFKEEASFASGSARPEVGATIACRPRSLARRDRLISDMIPQMRPPSR
jgi:hypothetical protein